ncbi:DUF805 domain-containing protein [Aeromicrobium panaciterrae]|uniref:DUF805 domain-containing protein n=1 Tax=Aeromicrobium panaciterrae TaxID=363861 RepID=UPI0031E48CF4
MNLEQAVRTVLSKYADFSGRARRSEFWFWELAVIIASIIGGIIDAIIGAQIFQIIIGLGTLIPSLAVGARRLHDIDKSGWWQLIGIIPIVGWIILIVWWATDGKPDNQYGPNPKGAATA